MLSPEQYAIERAICDKAQAFWNVNATFSKNGWSSLSAELAQHPDYAACDNAMRGRVEQYEILRDLPEQLTAYVSSEQTREQRDATNYIACRRYVTTWTGDILGECYLGSGWPVRSFIGPRMYQATAWIGGREYTGRTFGPGMCINLRLTA